MVKKILIIVIFIVADKMAYSQETDNIPKNYPGIYPAFVFDNISTAFGLEYERYLLVRSKFAWATRAGYLFKYKWGNANIISGTNENVSSVNWQLWTSGYWFSAADKFMKSYFINGGLGVPYTQSEEMVMLNPPVYTLLKGNDFSPAIEAGSGIQFYVTDGFDLRIGGGGTLYFPKPQDKPFSPTNTLTIRVAAGF